MTCIDGLDLRFFGKTRWLERYKWAGVTPTTKLRPGKQYYSMYSKNICCLQITYIIKTMKYFLIKNLLLLHPVQREAGKSASN